MPGNARQASRALAEAVGGGSLSPPTGRVVFALTVPANVAGDYDLDFAGKAGLSFRVLSCMFVKTAAPEAAVASTVQLQTTAGVAISDVMALNALADTGIVRAATINAAAYAIAAGGGLRIRLHAHAGTSDTSGILYVSAAITAASLGQAFQASPPLAAIVAGPLSQPSMIATLALAIPDMASGNVDFTLPGGLAFRILDFEVVKVGGAGGAVNTVQLQTAGGVAITDALSINIADQAIARAATINDAQHTIAANGIRVAVVKAGGNTQCVAYVTIALVSTVVGAKPGQSSAHLVQNAAAAGLPQATIDVVFACTTVQAPGNLDFAGIAGLAFRVIDAWFVKTDALAGGASTAQLQTAAGAANVTDALNINVADQAVVRAGQIDDANHAFAAGAGFRIATAGGDCRGIFYIRAAIV